MASVVRGARALRDHRRPDPNLGRSRSQLDLWCRRLLRRAGRLRRHVGSARTRAEGLRDLRAEEHTLIRRRDRDWCNIADAGTAAVHAGDAAPTTNTHVMRTRIVA